MAGIIVSTWRCQFCHNTPSEPTRMIAGDSGFICEDCVKRCTQMLEAGASPKSSPAPTPYVFDKLDQHFSPASTRECIVTSRTYSIRQQVDLQKTLDELFG